jgi:isopenicillin-N epimerase
MMNAPITGWGRLDPAAPETWSDEQIWLGTRNVSGFLAIPYAIDYFEKVGVSAVRSRIHYLAELAEAMLVDLFGTEPVADRNQGWYGSMAHVPLPGGNWSELQNELWVQSGIEVPIWQLNGRWWIRVSCHLYNTKSQLEFLTSELKMLTSS